jgi:esterase/lipase
MQIIHGGKDTCVPAGMSQEFHSTSASKDKRILVYESGRHFLLQDTEEVASRSKEDIAGWFCDHVPT